MNAFWTLVVQPGLLITLRPTFSPTDAQLPITIQLSALRSEWYALSSLALRFVRTDAGWCNSSSEASGDWPSCARYAFVWS